MTSKQINRLHKLAQAIYDKKGFNILALDVRGISTLTDYFLIAEGTSDRHVKTLARKVMEVFDENWRERPVHIEGFEEGDWVVLDYMNVIVHLFSPGLRDKYSLEELWHEGKIVDLAIDVSTKTRL